MVPECPEALRRAHAAARGRLSVLLGLRKPGGQGHGASDQGEQEEALGAAGFVELCPQAAAELFALRRRGFLSAGGLAKMLAVDARQGKPLSAVARSQARGQELIELCARGGPRRAGQGLARLRPSDQPCEEAERLMGLMEQLAWNELMLSVGQVAAVPESTALMFWHWAMEGSADACCAARADCSRARATACNRASSLGADAGRVGRERVGLASTAAPLAACYSSWAGQGAGSPPVSGGGCGGGGGARRAAPMCGQLSFIPNTWQPLLVLLVLVASSSVVSEIFNA